MSRLMGMIRVAKAQLGMDEDTYRDFLHNTLGKKTMAGSTGKEQWRVVEALKGLGFQPRPIHKGKELPCDPQAKKIRSLWLTMADCGVVRDRSEQALNSYVRRITGQTLANATTKQCIKVIETLKSWLDRCEDADARAKCMAVLRGNADAPPVINGTPIAEVDHGRVQ